VPARRLILAEHTGPLADSDTLGTLTPMSPTSELQARLAELFPPTVASCLSDSVPADATLLPQERDYTARMVEKRRNDFAHGRHCARRALKALGMTAAPITVGENREPIWPDGITGSISHTAGIAAAVAAHSSDLLAVGIDIELSAPLEPDIARMIRRPDETDWDGLQDSKILFSIKESIYKCIYPQLGFFVDFQEMKVVKSGSDCSYTAIPQNPKIDSGLLEHLRGRYSVDDDLIISSAWIEQA